MIFNGGLKHQNGKNGLKQIQDLGKLNPKILTTIRTIPILEGFLIIQISKNYLNLKKYMKRMIPQNQHQSRQLLC
jgi:hypothetical protein